MRIKKIHHVISTSGYAVGKPCIEVIRDTNSDNYSTEEITKSIRKIGACSRVLFSGEEPMEDQLEIADIIKRLQEGWEVIIRTTGKIMPDLLIRDMVTQWELNIPFDSDHNPDAVMFFIKSKNSYFEWDVKYEADLIEVQKIVFNFNIHWKKIILRPVIEDKKELKERIHWIEDFALNKGCNIGNPILCNIESKVKENYNDLRDTRLHKKARNG